MSSMVRGLTKGFGKWSSDVLTGNGVDETIAKSLASHPLFWLMPCVGLRRNAPLSAGRFVFRQTNQRDSVQCCTSVQCQRQFHELRP